MYFRLLILPLFIVSTALAQVETYLITDTNFRSFLSENHPEVLVQDSLLDLNSCKTVTEIDCSSKQILSLDGLQYFENLESLNCSYNMLTDLLNIPSKLTYLNTSYCVNLDTIGILPNGLTHFDCSYNQIYDLPNLPLNLDKLICAVNKIQEINYLPANLTHIDCSFNNLTKLPELPLSLEIINCSYNQLTSLPDLPPELGWTYNNPLNIFNNNISCVGQYSNLFDELLSIYPTCIDSNNRFTQNFSFPKGWSIFSINGLSTEQNLAEILDPIATELIMAKDNYGSVYYTEWDYNGVGDVDLGEAYHIKTNTETSLDLDLEYIQPEAYPVNLSEGWNLVGYLRNTPAPADLVLKELIDSGNLIIAKDYLGAVILPSWGFNGIGDMEVGKGYQVKVQENTLLHFLPNEVIYK